LLLKLPWFVSAPVVLALTVVMAFGFNYLLSDYFERSFLDEASPLAAASGSTATNQPAEPSPTSEAAPSTAPPTAGATASTAAPTVATGGGVLARGEFRDGDPGHNGEGTALLIEGADGALVLRVEEFSVTGGPDLFVILSTDPDGSRDSAKAGLDLGDLKATDGNFNYDIPSDTQVSQYKSVIIYCRSFNIVFAIATLEAGA
jgi:hypothetical protein